MVDIGDGTETSFWYDAWDNEDMFAEGFPAIRSHYARKTISVVQVCASGLDMGGATLGP
jgi:hypothetical protein